MVDCKLSSWAFKEKNVAYTASAMRHSGRCQQTSRTQKSAAAALGKGSRPSNTVSVKLKNASAKDAASP